MIAKPDVADVLDAHWPQVEQSATINSWQLRTLSAVRRCRTAALGSHVDGCTSCGHLRISYNPSFVGTAPTATALNARERNVISGYRHGKQNSYPCLTSM